ncbi:MAG TPA: hypothetical protein QGF44_01295 [Candidatus Nitrosopelagicus sp.]|nr:hypothetical protein [Candidatus Nitrosopelagicus sp.]
MSEPEETPVTTEEKEEEPAPLIEEAKIDEIITPETEEIDPDAEVSVHATMEKAIENYRKIKEGKKELTDKELENLEKECEAIRQREIIDVDEHLRQQRIRGKSTETFPPVQDCGLPSSPGNQECRSGSSRKMLFLIF